ncbi:protein phosphatase 2C domain-containing protein [Streptomyces sp. DH37]|uniref:protein phosphatase 2C domain-containing protein n=1 Tax=Streptomyces sp. DH37 TaxID=3040122 RepID=UPI0024429365|nr:protein phosphatase 2C domain-containing protein [Streptomyces sp. DH37]MDG9702361.1 protein phosphatase 2C domain-containing protein [Streptomyces sp. DH37]
MSQRGERADGPDWWSRLYDGDTPDTGGAPARDSVDERFASAARTVGRGRPQATPRAASEETAQATPRAASQTTQQAPPPRSPVPGFADGAPPAGGSEPAALPAADPGELPALAPDTALDGARHGCFTLRAASTRGDTARHRGEPRRETLLTARFGGGDDALVMVAVARGARTAPGAHRAAREVCHRLGELVGRSHARLVEDIRGARRGALKSGLHRLTGRAYGGLRADTAEPDPEADERAAGVRCLLVPVDPRCRTRVFFGTGGGGLFRLRDGVWQDLEPAAAPEPEADPRPGPGSGREAGPPPGPPFRFRASVARPGDTLLMCGPGLAGPMRGGGGLAARLAERWSAPEPPGLADFLTGVRPPAEGCAEDRTAAAVWEH